MEGRAVAYFFTFLLLIMYNVMKEMRAMKMKYLDKRGWRRLLDSTYDETLARFHGEEFLVGLIDMKKIRSPLVVPVVDKSVKVVDKDYKWLQILPRERRYSLTVMYDDKWQVLQYYFDVNMEHYLEPGNARRKDIYLDVLALPDGQYELVDEKDIQRALKNNKITEKDKDEAYAVARHIMDEIERDFGQFTELAAYCLQVLRENIK